MLLTISPAKEARKSPAKLRRKFATNFAENVANFTLEIAGAYKRHLIAQSEFFCDHDHDRNFDCAIRCTKLKAKDVKKTNGCSPLAMPDHQALV